MMIDLTDKEVCLIAQSIEATDWDYSGNGHIAASVLRKIREAVRAHLKRQEARHA